jgi:hypothetical protein
MPDQFSPAQDFTHSKDMVPYYPYHPFYVPPLPAMPPLREDNAGDDKPLSLHEAENEGADAPAASKKRQTSVKKKSLVRREKRKSRESLPWIK